MHVVVLNTSWREHDSPYRVGTPLCQQQANYTPVARATSTLLADSYFFHLASAAFLAIAARRFLLSLAARAGPPFLPPNLPRATAAAFLPSSVTGSGSPEVAARTMALASWFTSRGIFLLERFCMSGIMRPPF